MDENIKDERRCPNCDLKELPIDTLYLGVHRYDSLTRKLTYGHDKVCKYKCSNCGTVWTETWKVD